MNLSNTARERLLVCWRWVLTAVVSFVILFPLLWIFVSSITPSHELFRSPINYIPEHPTLENYAYLFRNVGLGSKVWSTVVIVFSTIIISTVVCLMAAYAFVRYRSRGLTLAFAFLLASMLIPDVVTARPLYDFMRGVNLFDTYTGLVILYISAVIPFTTIILRNNLSSIPPSIDEAAAIDGATTFQAIVHITIPLVRPAMATVCIINFITCLNNFFTPLFYANSIQVLSTAITTLPLRDNMYAVPWDLVSAMGWIIILPIIIFVAIFEKQIMGGIMSGAIKA